MTLATIRVVFVLATQNNQLEFSKDDGKFEVDCA